MEDKTSAGSKLKNFFREFTTHWSKPAPGKYVPYKEYLSVFIGGGGDYALQRVLGLLSFGTGCWLVVFYYQIPVLTFKNLAYGVYDVTVQPRYTKAMNMTQNIAYRSQVAPKGAKVSKQRLA